VLEAIEALERQQESGTFGSVGRITPDGVDDCDAVVAITPVDSPPLASDSNELAMMQCWLLCRGHDSRAAARRIPRAEAALERRAEG
jgi:hypothetical protein